MIQYKKIGKWMAVACVAALAASCTEDKMDKINEDSNHPHDVPAKFIVSDLTLSTPVSSVGGDFSLYTGIYIEHETGTTNQPWRADQRSGEPTASSTYNNSWTNIYTNILIILNSTVRRQIPTC